MNKHINCLVNISSEDTTLVLEALQDNIISGKGRFVELFENRLSDYFGVEFALSCCNATAGIHMILLHNRIGPGDEVMLPPTAPVMCVLPIIAVGAIPVFVDNQLDSFKVDLADLERKVTKRTRLFINVPMWGYANNIDSLVSLCQQKGIKVLEDNSHCHGTKLNNNYLGTFADYAIFSTHERKLITTGEGGFLLITNEADYLSLKEIRSFGELAVPIENAKLGSYGHQFGMNFKMSSINAALGISQLEKLSNKISARRKNAEYLINNLTSVHPSIRTLLAMANSNSNHYSVVFLAEPALKEAIETALLQKEIVSDPKRYGYCPLYQLPLFSQFANSCPNAESLTKMVFTLPTHEKLTITDLELYIKTIKDTIACTSNLQSA